jgi:phosphoribosylformylglycinamidine cyclo-ligase
VRSILAALKSGVPVKALAHITGGGLLENIPRVLPSSLVAEIELSSFAAPAVFSWLKSIGNIAEREMLRTFNCGIGMVAVVPEAAADDAERRLGEAGERVVRLGRMRPRQGAEEQVSFLGRLRFA